TTSKNSLSPMKASGSNHPNCCSLRWFPAPPWMWWKSSPKKRMPLSHLEISCSGEQDQNPPWTFRKIHLRFTIGGRDLTEKAVAQAIQLSDRKVR
ncbi:MAG: OsmC family protein, partial [Chloroflexota bacterium]